MLFENKRDIPKKEFIDKVLKEFQKHYTAEEYALFDPSILHDFASMSAVVMDKELVDKYLLKLSVDLKKLYKDAGHLDVNGHVKLKEHTNYPGQYGILDQFMLSWGQENGFNLGGKVPAILMEDDKPDHRSFIELSPSLPKVVGLVGALDLLSILLGQGYLFKDKGVTPRHGLYTHFLQLYIINEANKEFKFLKHDLIDLYKSFGTYPYTLGKYIPRPDGAGDDYISLWNLALDVAYGEDNRSPEFLNSQLTVNNKSYQKDDAPFIYEVLFGQLQKLTKQSIFSNIYSPNEEGIITETLDFAFDASRDDFLAKRNTGTLLNEKIYFPNEEKLQKYLYDDITTLYGFDHSPMSELESYLKKYAEEKNTEDPDPIIQRVLDLFDTEENYDAAHSPEIDRYANERDEIFKYLLNDLDVTDSKANYSRRTAANKLYKAYSSPQNADKTAFRSLCKVGIILLLEEERTLKEEQQNKLSTPKPS